MHGQPQPGVKILLQSQDAQAARGPAPRFAENHPRNPARLAEGTKRRGRNLPDVQANPSAREKPEEGNQAAVESARQVVPAQNRSPADSRNQRDAANWPVACKSLPAKIQRPRQMIQSPKF
jgi:hypothetical protein